MTARPDAPRPLALTMGEPAGIGPDITLLAWLRRARQPQPQGAGVFAIADPELLRMRAQAIGAAVPIATITDPGEVAEVGGSALPVLPLPLSGEVQPGAPSTTTAEAVLRSIVLAVQFTLEGRAGGVVTNPIQKSVLIESGFEHAGHTEFLGTLARAAGLNARPVMMLVCDELRVVPVTVHIPLADVPRRLTSQDIAEVARITAAELRGQFAIEHPRLAVAGLNPHAGEDGVLGSEDGAVIAPAVAELRAEGLEVRGPLPADTLFHARARATYDAAIAMYHDQALIPVKTLAFETAVNVTLGLPFTRTSPDHGTALDLAGTGAASPDSLLAALELADAMSTARRADRTAG